VLIKFCAHFVCDVVSKCFKGLGFFATSFDRANRFTVTVKLLALVFIVLGLSSHLAHLPYKDWQADTAVMLVIPARSHRALSGIKRTPAKPVRKMRIMIQ